jgi:hypothetical protein
MKLALTTILLSALLPSCIDAVSFPVLYCVNEAASAADCSAEASQAAESTKDWFDSYMTTHTDLRRERRHLLDCSRLCNADVTYFTIHYPCDCQKNRRLTAVDVRHTVRTLQKDPLVGPIQFFKSFTSNLPASACRTVLEMSQCFVTFVDKYDHDFSVPENEKAVDESGDVPSDFYLNKSYNPQTGKYEVYDPGTGELVKPENTTNNIDDDLPDEIYDPTTKKYYPVDPITGEIIKNEGKSSPTTTGTSGNNDDESFDEEYDPVTKTYHKVDPNTGKYIYEDGETPPVNGIDGSEEFSEEVYDPVTGVYHKVDPITGEYIEDVKQYEEVYDPSTGEYRKIDPTTGKYVN